jgi:hypothetical protein
VLAGGHPPRRIDVASHLAIDKFDTPGLQQLVHVIRRRRSRFAEAR